MKVCKKEKIISMDVVDLALKERNLIKSFNHPFVVSLKFSFSTKRNLFLVSTKKKKREKERRGRVVHPVLQPIAPLLHLSPPLFTAHLSLFFFDTPHIMDYIGGGELFYHLIEQKVFSEDVVRFYAAQIVLALSFLHEHNITYRDLKPENLLLDIRGNMCLCDFGMCKELVRRGERER